MAEDTAVTLTPNAFLRQTQRAVANPTTKPLYASDLQLSAAFNQDFAAAQQAARRGNPVPLARIDTAVRAAYRAIVAALTHALRPRDELGAFHQHRGMGHRSTWTGRRPPNICQYLQQRERGGLLDAFTDGAGGR